MAKLIPPYSTESERALLAALILDNNSYWRFGYKLTPDMFYEPVNKVVFGALRELYKTNEEIDVIALAEALKKSSPFNMAGGAAYLVELTEDIMSVASSRQHASVVTEKYRLREIMDVCNKAALGISGETVTADEVKDVIENKINNLFIDQETDKPKSLQVKEFIDDIVALRDSKGIRGPNWFLAQIDDCTGGVLPGYWVLAGTKKSGKTKIACQQLNQNIRNKVKTLYISMEPRFADVAVNLISYRHHINNRVFNRSADLATGNNMATIRKEADKLKDEPFDVKFLVGPTYDEIVSLMRREFHINDYKFFIIDYLQLIDPGFTEGRTMPAMITRGVNKIAYATAEMGIHVLALSQLSNRAEFEKAPHIGHVKDSGGITEAAMGILLIQNYKRSALKDRDIKDKAERRQVDIIIPALRHGESPKVIETQEQFEYSRLIPAEWKTSAFGDGREEEEDADAVMDF